MMIGDASRLITASIFLPRFPRTSPPPMPNSLRFLPKKLNPSLRSPKAFFNSYAFSRAISCIVLLSSICRLKSLFVSVPFFSTFLFCPSNACTDPSIPLLCPANAFTVPSVCLAVVCVSLATLSCSVISFVVVSSAMFYFPNAFPASAIPKDPNVTTTKDV